MKCEICGKDDIKNLGVHKYKAHQIVVSKKGFQEEVERKLTMYKETLKVDEITEKPLSELLSNMKDILKTFRHELDVRISDRGGRTSEVEIKVRIQI